MRKLTKYDEAIRMLAEVERVDDVKQIRDKAIAMEVYAKRAKNREMIERATRIRKYAERRLGELMQELREMGKLAKGGAGPGRGKKGVKGRKSKNPPLKELGFDKPLADRARKAAAMSAKDFAASVDKTVNIMVAAAMGDKEVVKQARVERQVEKKKKRETRNAKLAADIKSLPDKKYGVIYADPGWQYETYNDDTGSDRAASNHYMVETVEEIGMWPVGDIAADDCVLYLWGTVPMLPEALAVMAQWGFHYKSNFCWDKEIAGTGHWNRNVHEHLLIGTRGKAVAPAPGDQYESIFEERRRGHSVKPEKAVEIIEAYHAGIPKIELNRRGKPRKGWDGWGNEAEVEPASASDPAPAPTPEPAPADPEEVARAVEKLFDSTFGKPEAAE